jgi:hypothetical protein
MRHQHLVLAYSYMDTCPSPPCPAKETLSLEGTYWKGEDGHQILLGGPHRNCRQNSVCLWCLIIGRVTKLSAPSLKDSEMLRPSMGRGGC